MEEVGWAAVGMFFFVISGVGWGWVGGGGRGVRVFGVGLGFGVEGGGPVW